LAKTALERFAEKVDLIYDFNPNTPLFVRKADAKIDENDLAGAVEILSRGLETYPDYSTGYIILGKAFTLQGDYENAVKAFQHGSMLIGSEQTLKFYAEQIENIKKHRSPFTLARRSTFVDEPPEAAEPAAGESDIQISLDELVTDDLAELASKISKAKMPPPQTGENNFPDVTEGLHSTQAKIYSETMAKIYMSQGNYAEAIDVFENLSLKDPSKKEYYRALIEDLKKKLG